ncbi:MAG: radical SAM protein, partial [Candidatus Micrarchaeota archaeon]
MNEVEFVFPFKTRAVSITGARCALNCAHCNHHYLEQMTGISVLKHGKGIKSVLLSGGCDENGEVPLLKFKKQILALKKKYKIIAHTGLVAPEKARELKGLVDVVSFDFPPSTRAVREVFGIKKTRGNYAESLAAL